MHTYDQYQVPAKMRKRSRNSIVFDVANFLLSKTACRARPWVVGYVRKRCHSLMKDLVITWHAQRYLTKTQNVFRKSFMFKECWERARERLHRGSDKSNTLDNEEPLTKVSPVRYSNLYYNIANLMFIRDRPVILAL